MPNRDILKQNQTKTFLLFPSLELGSSVPYLFQTLIIRVFHFTYIIHNFRVICFIINYVNKLGTPESSEFSDFAYNTSTAIAFQSIFLKIVFCFDSTPSFDICRLYEGENANVDRRGGGGQITLNIFLPQQNLQFYSFRREHFKQIKRLGYECQRLFKGSCCV